MTWPLCECGCGEPVAVNRKTGLPTRYATHQCHKRQYRRRVALEPKTKPLRRCFTCKRRKAWSAFDDLHAKRCKACKRARATARCEICGELAGMNARGRQRKYCLKPECESAWISQLRKSVVVEQAKRLAARKTKRCPMCAVRKPLTREHWSPKCKKPAPDGSMRWDVYCKPCRAALARDRHRSSPETREKQRIQHRRYRERIKARRAADPAFDTEMRQRVYDQNRRSRAKRAERENAQAEEPKAGGAHLPALPLAVFIDREAQRAQEKMNGHAPDMDSTLERVCMRLGVASRSVRDWRVGSRQSVLADVADRVMVNAGVLWFDVYDPDVWPAEHAIAAQAFA